MNPAAIFGGSTWLSNPLATPLVQLLSKYSGFGETEKGSHPPSLPMCPGSICMCQIALKYLTLTEQEPSDTFSGSADSE